MHDLIKENKFKVADTKFQVIGNSSKGFGFFFFFFLQLKKMIITLQPNV